VTVRLAIDDRRKRYVELTGKGKSILKKSRRLWRLAEGRFEKIFGKESAAELRAVLIDIAGNKELNSLPLR
jgi:DNA-binding MarR family transcriptional regulator